MGWLASVLKHIGKYLAVNLIEEPEKIFKYIILVGLLPLLLLLLLINIPSTILSSFPSFFVADKEVSEDILSLYSNAPIIVNENNYAWIENQKSRYPNHEVVINDSSYIDWQQLVAIDSVRLTQDFSSVTQNSIVDLANKFISKSAKTETYTEQQDVEREITYYVLEPRETIETYTEIVNVEKTRTYTTYDKKETVEYYVSYKVKSYYWDSPRDSDGLPSRWYMETRKKWVSKSDYDSNKSTYTLLDTKTKVEWIPRVVTEKYTVKEEVQKTRTVIEWVEVKKTRKETVTENVTKKRVIFTITNIDLSTVLTNLGLNEEDKILVNHFYTNTAQLVSEGSFSLFDPNFDPSSLKEYPSGSAILPYYNQGDARWGNRLYGKSGTIRDTGCGPTALAMVVAGLTNNPSITPLSMANWSVANGHRAYNAGSYWSLMTSGGKNFGLNVETISRKNPAKVVESLSKGYPIIVSMGRGQFTRGGHFIVLRGLTADGKILVHDSASVSRSQKAWDVAIIMGESSRNGGENGSPFWVFKP